MSIIGTIVFFVCLTAMGCERETSKQAKAPPVTVNLPASPSMAEPTFVEKYTDGSFTVAGLIKNRADNLGDRVKVKGYVQVVHRCPNNSAPCDKPEHVVLVDDVTRPHKRLVVVGGQDTDFASLAVNQAVTLDGTYLQSDPGGVFVRTEGLLVLKPKPKSNNKSQD